jgi:hypothetical protein
MEQCIKPEVLFLINGKYFKLKFEAGCRKPLPVSRLHKKLIK